MEFSEDNTLCFKKTDLSRKGSIDNRIVKLVNFINSLSCYQTTSSCSGRTIIFTNTETKKKGCCWVFVSHDTVSTDDIVDALNNHSGSAILKFEPFVLHTQCTTLEDAKKLLHFGIESGFKNSGISIGKAGKIIVATRSTLSLEIPLSNNGTLLVSKEYLSFVVNICNEKMLDNWQRIEREKDIFKFKREICMMLFIDHLDMERPEFYTCLQKINNSTVIKTKCKNLHKKGFSKPYQQNGEKNKEEIEDSVNCYDALSDFQSLINDSVD